MRTAPSQGRSSQEITWGKIKGSRKACQEDDLRPEERRAGPAHALILNCCYKAPHQILSSLDTQFPGARSLLCFPLPPPSKAVKLFFSTSSKTVSEIQFGTSARWHLRHHWRLWKAENQTRKLTVGRVLQPQRGARAKALGWGPAWPCERPSVAGECVQTGDGIRGVEAEGTEPRRLWQGLWFSWVSWEDTRRFEKRSDTISLASDKDYSDHCVGNRTLWD